MLRKLSMTSPKRETAGRETPLPLCYGNIFLRIRRTDIVGAGADQTVIVELLDDVGRPSADSGDGEYGGEKIDVNSQRVVSRRGIEVHVGVELFVGLHKFFDLLRHLEPLALAAALSQIAGHFAQVRGSRIFCVIDTMAEAWDFLFLRQHPLDVGHRVGAGLVDVLQDIEYRLIRAAVQRPFQRSMAAVTAECISESVAATTRAAKVEALSS
jgi:hypothetical protein